MIILGVLDCVGEKVAHFFRKSVRPRTQRRGRGEQRGCFERSQALVLRASREKKLPDAESARLEVFF
jgi:hypothetical protein